MKQILLAIVVSGLFFGCGGTNRIKISGVLTKHNKDAQSYFTIRDENSSKLYRVSKESTIPLEDLAGHKISMKAKVLEDSTNAQGVKTVVSCTKCHHKVKEL